MFNQKEIEAYKSIKAPDSLRDNIMADYDLDYTPKHTLYSGRLKAFASVAACVILIIAFSVFTMKDFGSFSASVNGERLSSESILFTSNQPALMTADARALSTVSVPIELDIHRDTEITVSNGTMQVLDDKTGEVLFTETTINTDTDTSVCWEVIIDDASPYKMTVSDTKKTHVITLAFDDTAGEWTICCEQLD